MYDEILFPTDGSDGAVGAVDHVLDIAATNDATVHILFVTDTTQMSATRMRGDIVDALEAEGEDVVSETAARARCRLRDRCPCRTAGCVHGDRGRSG